MKLIADFTINLPGIDVVGPAESVAGVEQVAAVADVDRVGR